MDVYESTLASTTLFVSGWMGLGIHMPGVAWDTLHSIYGKTTQLQITVYFAPIKCSQIEGSVICCDC